jgi:hypothetical protein
MIEFIRGIRTPVLTTSSPASFRTASNASVNLESRSRIRNFALALASSKSMTRFRPSCAAWRRWGVRWQRKRRPKRRWLERWWGWLQDALAGYGYAPGRALLLLVGAFVAGCLVFNTPPPGPRGFGPPPCFNAALYTLDLLIPAHVVGLAGDWDAQGAGLAMATGLSFLGWLLTITVIAAITRSFSRN